MKRLQQALVLSLVSITLVAQIPSQSPVNNPDFDREIRSLIDFSVPIVTCKELSAKKDEVLLLDAREKEEYEVSHIPGAKHIGYNRFKKTDLEDIPKDQKIVVYCSVGYRSEKIGEKLLKMGYTRVENLYGSIFEWVNQGNPVEDMSSKSTDQIHTYNKKWSQWVDEGKAQKKW